MDKIITPKTIILNDKINEWKNFITKKNIELIIEKNKNNNFKFINCDFYNDFSFLGNSDIKNKDISIEFINCYFYGKVFFGDENNLTYKSLIFDRSKFFNKFTIKGLKIDTIKISDSYMKGIFKINTSFKSLTLEKNTENYTIDSNKVELIEKDKSFIKTNNFILKIDILKNNKNSEINLRKLKNIDELVFGGTKNAKINFIGFDKVYMSEKGKGLFLFYDFIINNFTYINSTITPEKIVFNNMKFAKKLSFINLYLGESLFNGVEIKKLYLENSTLNDCIFNGVDFLDYKLDEKGIDGKNLDPKKIKDNYRQLKFVMDKNGNHTEANKFYGLEMEYEYLYNKEEKLFEKGIFKGLIELWKEDFLGLKSKKLGDRIILFLGKYISEFGNNWLATLKYIYILAVFSATIDYSYYQVINGIKNKSTIPLDYTDIVLLLGIFIIEIFLLTKYFFIFVIILSIILIISSNYEIIKTFFEYLYPLFGMNFDFINNLNIIEIGGLIIYKIIYATLIWHLVIALKRTTKR